MWREVLNSDNINLNCEHHETFSHMNKSWFTINWFKSKVGYIGYCIQGNIFFIIIIFIFAPIALIVRERIYNC